MNHLRICQTSRVYNIAKPKELMCFRRVNRVCFLLHAQLTGSSTGQRQHTSEETQSQVLNKEAHSQVLCKESQTSDMAALESLLEGLRGNSLITMSLPLDEESDMALLLEALRCNTSVEEVNIDIYECFRYREQSSREVLGLFRALSMLPKLQRLWVDSGREGSPFYTLNVSCLALFL